jgi:hypothetical protein
MSNIMHSGKEDGRDHLEIEMQGLITMLHFNLPNRTFQVSVIQIAICGTNFHPHFMKYEISQNKYDEKTAITFFFNLSLRINA